MDTSKKDEEFSGGSMLQIIRGLPISTTFKKVNIEEIFDFMPADGDVIIATYPKTGTTWMNYIVHQILSKGEYFPSVKESAGCFLEMCGVSALKEMTSKPRVYKHHIPYNMLKKNAKAKLIYVYRKPEDTFVSFYHFMKNMQFAVDFDTFFEDFLNGNVSYGRYFEHVLSYWQHKDDENMLLVSYEKLKTDTKSEILKIAKFLGEDYFKILVDDESILNKIIEHTSFDYMKKNLVLTMPRDPKAVVENDESSKETPHITVNFFRKGIIGDGKSSLKENHLHRLYELARQLMKDTDILSEWIE